VSGRLSAAKAGADPGLRDRADAGETQTRDEAPLHELAPVDSPRGEFAPERVPHVIFLLSAWHFQPP